jgi:serine/threonine protein kinase
MTYAPGVSLETYQETYSVPSFPFEEVIDDSRGAFVQIVSILIVSRIIDRELARDNLLFKHLNAVGIVHKDIKSDNIRFSRRNDRM